MRQEGKSKSLSPAVTSTETRIYDNGSTQEIPEQLIADPTVDEGMQINQLGDAELQGKSSPSFTAGLAGGASGATGKAGANVNWLNSEVTSMENNRVIRESCIGLTGGARGASGEAEK